MAANITGTPGNQHRRQVALINLVEFIHAGNRTIHRMPLRRQNATICKFIVFLFTSNYILKNRINYMCQRYASEFTKAARLQITTFHLRCQSDLRYE